jgi:hypothetical protein
MTSAPPTNPTRRTSIDVLFGILIPIVCFVLDSTLLKTSGNISCGGPLLGATTGYFIYPAVTIGILIFTFWLFVGKKFPQWGAFMAGIFWTGAILAFVLGIPLFIFLFVTWMTGYVYARNGLEAWKIAIPTASLPLRGLSALGGMVFVLGFSWLIYHFLVLWLPPVIYHPCPNV